MWITFGQPCISPFLPFYIGINAIPDIVSTKANPVAQVFERLRLALDYHPEYRPEITHYCTVFEIQTIEEAEKLEADIIILADDGKEMEARALLTEFVEKKCNETMSVGSKWLEFLQNLPLTQK
jgi:dipeptidase